MLLFFIIFSTLKLSKQIIFFQYKVSKTIVTSILLKIIMASYNISVFLQLLTFKIDKPPVIMRVKQKKNEMLQSVDFKIKLKNCPFWLCLTLKSRITI